MDLRGDITTDGIPALYRRLAERSLSCADLVRRYQERVQRLNPAFSAVIEMNPEADAIAARRDTETGQGTPRGALHGIPILLKDNIDTGDRMTTTAGSLALDGSVAPADAFVVRQLREAGAVLLGKTNLSEWANFRSTRSSSGWSSRGGQTRNAYDLTRTPGGSSSGSAVAVALGMCAGAIGTETEGSIVIPAAMNSLVGIKPTVGLVGRTGIIPISHSQDTAGPIARTVEDAAALLAAMLGRDPDDPRAMEPGALGRDLMSLDAAALRGARLGVAPNHHGFHDGVERVFRAALDALRALGATLVDDVDLPSSASLREVDSEVMRHEFKAGLNNYLARLGANAPVRTLADLIAFNDRHADRTMPWFGQERLIEAEATAGLDSARYLESIEEARRLAATEGIDAAMARHDLDAIVAPTVGAPWTIDLVNGDHRSPCCSAPAAIAGYPHVTVPAGYLHGLPLGLSLFAEGSSDARLVRYAYAFEQATHHRRPPTVVRGGGAS